MTDNNILPIERWTPFRRKLPYGVIKNGFIVNPEDPLELIPDPEQIKWLEQAFDYLEAGSSLREVTEWVTQKLKKTLAHQTINNLYKTYRKPYTRKKTQKKTGPKRTKESIKLAESKKAITVAIRRANKLEKEKQEKLKKTAGQLKPEDFDEPPAPKEKKTPKVFVDAPASVNIVFKPNPGPQTSFLSATEEEVLYGGSAGGEPKSWFSASFSRKRSK